jgi:hypothetical protein
VYADWLEEHGDARGPFLRAFVEAARGNGKTPLPNSERFSKAWRNLCGVTLGEGILAFDLLAHRDAILKLARPTVEVTTSKSRDSALAIGTTKFGGRPDLPRGEAWPTRDKGPLGFLAQINLADLAQTFTGRELPGSGLLSFFVYNDPDTGEPGDEGGFRALYFPDPSALSRRDPPAGIARWHKSPACRATLAETLDLPYRDSPWKSDLKLKGRLRQRDRDWLREDTKPSHMSDAAFAAWRRECDYGELRDALIGSPHHLLGYADPYVASCDPIPGPGWRHLLTLHSDDNLEWCWGDGDRLYWFVPEDDLRAMRLDNTRIACG